MATGGQIALPQGYNLHEYRIESTLGIGGFGLTYLATDSNLNVKVAIKEYLPSDIALRCEDQSVQPTSDTALDTFKWGRSRFLDESRALASFRHPNIVRVLRFFEANQTAYMVMEFVAGQALSEWIRNRRPLPEHAVIALAAPLLDGLDVIHRGGHLHRDIKPGNVLVRHDGSPVLLDFGSARIVKANTELTAIVTPGYAPFEQYHSHGNQGPWSDLYSFGAMLYWIVTGDKPVEAAARIRNDVMLPAAEAGDRSHYTSDFLKAIDWALAPLEEARPQSVAEFRKAFERFPPVPSGSIDQTTVLVNARPTAPPSAAPISSPPANQASTGPATSAVFDRETLRKVEAELAQHLGPIAAVVVRSAAKESHTLAQLTEMVAADIPEQAARTAFVRKFSAGDKSTLTGGPTRSPGTALRSKPDLTAALRFDAATLASAESALAQYIGAIARLVVKRVAVKARDESELYLLIADELEDKDEKKAFIRKAVSVSRKQ